jgi:hypothetical protein
MGAGVGPVDRAVVAVWTGLLDMVLGLVGTGQSPYAGRLPMPLPISQ